MPLSSKVESSVPVTFGEFPEANCVKAVEPLDSYSRVQEARFGLETMPATWIGAVTSVPSLGFVIVTIGPGPVMGPTTRNPDPE